MIGGKNCRRRREDILYFERKGRETGIHTCWGVYAVWDKLQTLMERLPILDFVRCHNSYIVNLLSVREMRDNEFIMTEGSSVPISRRYAKTVKEAFVRWAGNPDFIKTTKRTREEDGRGNRLPLLYRCYSIASMSSLGRTPTDFPVTFPPFSTTMVGMLITWKGGGKLRLFIYIDLPHFDVASVLGDVRR